MKELLEYDKIKLIETLWECDPDIHDILISSYDLQDARNKMFDHLNGIERHLYNIYSDKSFKDMNLLEKNNARECIRILKNVIRTENETISNFSALQSLYSAAKGQIDTDHVTEGFLTEFIFLFKGINGNSGMYIEKDVPLFLKLIGMDAVQERMKSLDQYAWNMERGMRRYKVGLDKDLIKERGENKKYIMNLFNADENNWQDYKWHLTNIIRDIDALKSVVRLSADELKGLECAAKHRIPFQITPYYLSLFDRENTGKYDHAIRAQVLPGENYCLNYIQSKESGADLDFMDEKSTSPIKGITRRYPQILILKPFDSCPQICVYCQRNWEITDIKDATFSKVTMKNALQWIEDNPHISEVLITGGDPLTMNDTSLNWMLSEISGIDPYYTFNTKGKDETIDYRVPIARIEQERKEEARFLPGLVRTDEAVFNVPSLENHIFAHGRTMR